MIEHSDESLAAAARLLVPGERLGWILRARPVLPSGLAAADPLAEQVRPRIREKALHARAVLPGRLRKMIAKGLAVTASAGLIAWLGHRATLPWVSQTFTRLAVWVSIATVVMVVADWQLSLWVQRRPDRVAGRLRKKHQKRVGKWQARLDAAEQARWGPTQVPRWGAARPQQPIRRLDVIGGSVPGRRAFLTVFGASMLATHGPMTVVDLSGLAVYEGLAQLVGSRGLTVDTQVLSDRLADSDLLAGLDSEQLVDAIIESLYGAVAEYSRQDRLFDRALLSDVVGALGDEVTLRRLVAGLRVFMGEPGNPAVLTAAERDHIADELRSDGTKKTAHERLLRLESFLSPLVTLGETPRERPAAELTCLSLKNDGRSARDELLADLTIQWLTRRVANDPAASRTLVIMGADDLALRHVDRLSDQCAHNDVRLVLMYRNLRDAARKVVGDSNAVVFMRLGNHEQATAAADYIGRQHKFVISQFTQNKGGSDSGTTGTNEGVSTTRGRSGSTTRSGSFSELVFLARTWSRAVGRSWNKAHSRGTSRSQSIGTTWGTAATDQRVYEHTVDPRELQHLPEYAMLLVESTWNGPRLRAVECNPDLVTLDDVSMDPLPEPSPWEVGSERGAPILDATPAGASPACWRSPQPAKPRYGEPPAGAR